MDPQDYYEKQEDHIDQMYAEGLLTDAQRNEELRELQRDYATEAEMAAQDAYETERARW